MKIIVTGSIGHISKPLTEELVQKGHAVTVISSNPEKQKDIAALGATAAIGSLEDAHFLAATFAGADAVYCMIPPNNYSDQRLDLPAYYRRIAGNYAQAVGRKAGNLPQQRRCSFRKRLGYSYRSLSWRSNHG